MKLRKVLKGWGPTSQSKGLCLKFFQNSNFPRISWKNFKQNSFISRYALTFTSGKRIQFLIYYIGREQLEQFKKPINGTNRTATSNLK